MKKALAVGGILLFSLMIVGLPYSARQNPIPPGDYGALIGQLIGVVLIITGLFYSVRWYLKLDGHTYKLARQAWASILVVYALIAVLIGAAMVMTSAVFGAVMVIVWSAIAVASWKWRKRLRNKESAAAASKLPA